VPEFELRRLAPAQQGKAKVDCREARCGDGSGEGGSEDDGDKDGV